MAERTPKSIQNLQHDAQRINVAQERNRVVIDYLNSFANPTVQFDKTRLEAVFGIKAAAVRAKLDAKNPSGQQGIQKTMTYVELGN